MHKADFERLLAAPLWSRSAHFALHHVAGLPAGMALPAPNAGLTPVEQELSTDLAQSHPPTVDNFAVQHWLGAVVPKRHARRSVTRNLLRRQIRATFQRCEAALPAGLWLIRLRQPFDAVTAAGRSGAKRKPRPGVSRGADSAGVASTVTPASAAVVWRSAASEGLTRTVRSELERLLTTPVRSSRPRVAAAP